MVAPASGRRVRRWSLRVTVRAMATAAGVATVALWITAPGVSEAMAMKGKPGNSPGSSPLKMPRKKEHLPPPSIDQLEVMANEAAIKGCIKGGDWEQALQVLDHMAERGLQRRSQAWGSAISTCGKAGRWELAMQLMESMCSDKIAPDHNIYISAMEACEAGVAPDQAVRMLEDMQRRGMMPNMGVYSQVIKVLFQTERQEEARRLFNDANAKGMFNIWIDRGRILDLRDLPIEVAEVVIRFAVEDRALSTVGGKAGKGGFHVITGPSQRRDARKQDAVLRVMEQEFGLKVRLDPAKLGRVTVKAMELQRLGKEMQMSYSGARVRS